MISIPTRIEFIFINLNYLFIIAVDSNTNKINKSPAKLSENFDIFNNSKILSLQTTEKALFNLKIVLWLLLEFTWLQFHYNRKKYFYCFILQVWTWGFQISFLVCDSYSTLDEPQDLFLSTFLSKNTVGVCLQKS